MYIESWNLRGKHRCDTFAKQWHSRNIAEPMQHIEVLQPLSVSFGESTNSLATAICILHLPMCTLVSLSCHSDSETQVLACLADNSHTLTSSESRQLSQQYAPYTIRKLLQVVKSWLETWHEDSDEGILHNKLVQHCSSP